MQLNAQQLYTHKKLLKHDKSFVFWPRQTGKSYLVTHFIEDFVNNNKDQNILFISNKKNYIKNSRLKISNEIGHLILDKHRSDDLDFTNDNYLKFISINQPFEYVLNTLSPSLIIFDEIMSLPMSNNFKLIKDYIDKSNCKCIYTSTFMELDVIKLLDSKNDFYINIIPPRHSDEFYDLDIEYVKKNIKELSYKPDELLDYADLQYQRKVKLRKLNSL